jgi:predicted deacylase
VFGKVVDVLGDRSEIVRAAHAGIVLVLHTFARVEAGESLGVILEDRR